MGVTGKYSINMLGYPSLLETVVFVGVFRGLLKLFIRRHHRLVGVALSDLSLLVLLGYGKKAGAVEVQIRVEIVVVKYI